MAVRRNTALPDNEQIRRLQWYLLVALVAGGTGLLVLAAVGYLTGLPDPIPTGFP